jgi:hypothetical protein
MYLYQSSSTANQVHVSSHLSFHTKSHFHSKQDSLLKVQLVIPAILQVKGLKYLVFYRQVMIKFLILVEAVFCPYKRPFFLFFTWIIWVKKLHLTFIGSGLAFSFFPMNLNFCFCLKSQFYNKYFLLGLFYANWSFLTFRSLTIVRKILHSCSHRQVFLTTLWLDVHSTNSIANRLR